MNSGISVTGFVSPVFALATFVAPLVPGRPIEPCLSRAPRRPRRGWSARPRRLSPCRRSCRAGQHERLWRRAPCPRRSPPSSAPTQPIGPPPRIAVAVAFLREFVAVLDQQPVGALAAGPVTLHPHQHPAAVQPLAVEREFQIAVRERRLRRRIASGSQIAAVPELHRAAAILALREWCLRSRRSRAGDPRPRPRAACRADRATDRASPPRI